MNLALSGLPKFTPLSGGGRDQAKMLNGSNNIMPSIGYIQQAYDDALEHGWARKPVIEFCIPSLLDDSLAPKDCHVMSLFCQHFQRHLPDGARRDRGICPGHPQSDRRDADQLSARHRAQTQHGGRRHLSRRTPSRPALFHAPGCWRRGLSHAHQGVVSWRLRRTSRWRGLRAGRKQLCPRSASRHLPTF